MIKQFAEIGAVRLGFLGGEPLLRSDLAELVDAGREEGMIVSVVTNATLLPGRIKLVEKVDALLISLDGEAAVHDAHRGSGSFDATIEGIETALEAGIPVSFVAVVSSESINHLDGVLKIAERYGRSVMFQPVVREDRIQTMGEHHLDQDIKDGYPSLQISPEGARRVFSQLESWKNDGRPVANSAAYLRGMQRDTSMPIPGRCPAIQSVLAVLPDGRLVPCCEQHGAGEQPGADTARPLIARLSELTPPPCDHCTSIGNAEMRQIMRMEPRALASAVRLLV